LDISWALFPVLGEGRLPGLAAGHAGGRYDWLSDTSVDLETAGPARQKGSDSDVTGPAK
jgi:hypothetical protein